VELDKISKEKKEMKREYEKRLKDNKQEINELLTSIQNSKTDLD